MSAKVQIYSKPGISEQTRAAVHILVDAPLPFGVFDPARVKYRMGRRLTEGENHCVLHEGGGTWKLHGAVCKQLLDNSNVGVCLPHRRAAVLALLDELYLLVPVAGRGGRRVRAHGHEAGGQREQLFTDLLHVEVQLRYLQLSRSMRRRRRARIARHPSHCHTVTRRTEPAHSNHQAVRRSRRRS